MYIYMQPVNRHLAVTYHGDLSYYVLYMYKITMVEIKPKPYKVGIKQTVPQSENCLALT